MESEQTQKSDRGHVSHHTCKSHEPLATTCAIPHIQFTPPRDGLSSGANIARLDSSTTRAQPKQNRTAVRFDQTEELQSKPENNRKSELSRIMYNTMNNNRSLVCHYNLYVLSFQLVHYRTDCSVGLLTLDPNHLKARQVLDALKNPFWYTHGMVFIIQKNGL